MSLSSSSSSLFLLSLLFFFSLLSSFYHYCRFISTLFNYYFIIIFYIFIYQTSLNIFHIKYFTQNKVILNLFHYKVMDERNMHQRTHVTSSEFYHHHSPRPTHADVFVFLCFFSPVFHLIFRILNCLFLFFLLLKNNLF